MIKCREYGNWYIVNISKYISIISFNREIYQGLIFFDKISFFKGRYPSYLAKIIFSQIIYYQNVHLLI